MANPTHLQSIQIDLPAPFDMLMAGVPNMTNMEKIRRVFFIYLAVLMSFGALVWGVICLSFSLHLAAVVPFGYVVLTIINLALCKRSIKHSFHCNLQVFISISLPFVFQFMLGGIAASGCVMLWSIVAIMGAMTFQDKRMVYLWFVLMIVSILASCLVESMYFSERQFTGNGSVLLALNIVLVCSILFFIARHFIDKQVDLREKLMSHTDIINEKNVQINLSMESAQNIQKNILPTSETMAASFFDHFVYNRPKDVVSGDFYWFAEVGQKVFLACADCTGHGLPGAFMSVMGYNLLNQVFYKDHLHDPAAMLAQLDLSIRKELRQETSGNQDGMDISIIAYDRESRMMEFAGARSHMVKTDVSGKLTVLKGDQSKVGGVEHGVVSRFTTQQFMMEPGSRLFLMSDGITDQFGGPLGERLMFDPFCTWLESQRHLGMNQTFFALKNFYADWIGEEEQTDDILVIGLEF